MQSKTKIMKNVYSFIEVEQDRTVLDRLGLLLDVLVAHLVKTRSDPDNITFLLSLFCSFNAEMQLIDDPTMHRLLEFSSR